MFVNPYAKEREQARRVARLRSVLLESVTEDDWKKIVKALNVKAQNGNASAAKLLIDLRRKAAESGE